MRNAEDETLRNKRGVRDDEIKLPGLTERAKGRGVAEDADVGFIAYVVQGE